jgi:tRNA modification GTPase
MSHYVRNDDTICALSTSLASPSARAILRVTGRGTLDATRAVGLDRVEHGKVTTFPLLIGVRGGVTVRASAYPFLAPRSLTGQDLIELHLPASPFIVKRTLEALMRAGARQAEPGEFTARAYLNGKLNLSQAEGVAATIAASSRRELDAARQLLAGELATRLAPAMDRLADTLALVEVGIDFADEDVTFLPRAEVAKRVEQSVGELTRLVSESPRLERLSLTPRVVLAGLPNAGKSTLMNALARKHRAVVSDVAGTTRDALSADIVLARGTVTLVDVAGLDDSADGDEIAIQMRDAARREIARADLLIRVIDIGSTQTPVVLPRAPDLTVLTKADLADAFPREAIAVSAFTGAGLESLRHTIDALAFGRESSASTSLALNARHVAHIEQAIEALRAAQRALHAGDEIVAHLLRDALDQLGQVLGSVSADDVLGRIFSRFCIGK